MKEGSQDPVLTATAPGFGEMNSSSTTAPTMAATSTSTQPNTNSRIPAISTASEGGGGSSYEVVYTEKTTEIDGSEELITLHYAFEDTNTTLFDEVAASESLLMLSEIRDNSKSEGIKFRIGLFASGIL